MSTPAQQSRGVTEDEGEQKEGHRETLRDGDTSEKDGELQVDTGETTGKDLSKIIE